VKTICKKKEISSHAGSVIVVGRREKKECLAKGICKKREEMRIKATEVV
jgi:hypothetical protein